MSVWKQLYRRLAPNPFDQFLKRAKQRGSTRFLIGWNRGLGDIPLGLYALVHRLKQWIPQAQVTFLTRPDLEEGFALLPQVQVICDPLWKRGEKVSMDAYYDRKLFDEIIRDPDPTYWVSWQLGKLVPKLQWQEAWDAKAESFGLEKGASYVGVHVHTQTAYGYEKNWPDTYWQELFNQLKGFRIVLFGFTSKTLFQADSLIDLRGKTTLLEMLSIIKNYCSYLIAPDSGVLSMSYYLQASFALKVVSLWADPYQGILKQKVCSPNPLFVHTPLIAPDRDLSRITAKQVYQALNCKGRVCI